ncbi:MAG: ThiF family adenylyltransferase [Patescibacteria group bacterium]
MKNAIDKVLERIIAQKSKVVAESKPLILDLSKTKDKHTISKLLSSRKVQQVIDDYKEQLHELFAVKNPTLVYAQNFADKFAEYFSNLEKQKPLSEYGRWVYFPWLGVVTHILEDKDFQLVRTARNKNLITKEEQERFYNAVIGIGGLSVGNSVAMAIVLQGGGRHIRLADFDRLALSNTNRVNAGIQNLGLLKVEITARQIYTLNPYAKVELFTEGLTTKNIRKFFVGPPKLDIVVDELDNIAIKFLIREEAKRHRLAVVMAADNGDNAVVDIERYDKNPKQKFFHGRLGNVNYKGLTGLDKFGIGKTITKHIGPENVTERMKESLLEMGKTIVSWPQLGGAALLNGSAVAYCVRKILNGQQIESNRAIISLDEQLLPTYHSSIEKKKRLKAVNTFKKVFGL